MADNYALIIGIDHYKPIEQSGLRKLNGAIGDAEKFDAWVRDPNGGNVNPNNIHLVKSTLNPLTPIVSMVHDELQLILDEVKLKGSADRLYFYFAGHGLAVADETKNNALCTSDWTNRQGGNALSTTNHEQLFNSTGLFREIVFLADCCRNTKWNARPGPSPITPELYEGPYKGKVSIFKAYATQYDEQSFEVEKANGDTRGIFTEVLLKGLQGGAAENGVIDGPTLRKYLLKETPELAVKYGYFQEPDIENKPHTLEEIIFGKVADPNVLVSCTINFSSALKGPIILEDSSSEVIGKYEPKVTPTISVNLKKEMHLLTDRGTGKEQILKINPQQNTPLNVDF
ncbi:MAG: caspase family protein [Bacteroidetes bacterium]|nr:caspase family protein [Bacteroidota bacterium]